MHRVQELVRLHRLGVSGRAMSRELGMGRDTIRAYCSALAVRGLLDGDAEQLPDQSELREAIESELPSKKPPQQRSSIESWREAIAEMVEHGAQARAIFDRLRIEHEDFKASESAVKRMVRRLVTERGVRAEDVAIPVLSEPGDVAQVDFGSVGRLYDPEKGTLRRAWVFVLVLGYSRHMWAAIVFDQKATTWAELHAQAFRALGGVPQRIVPDNLKAAVIRAAFTPEEDPCIHRTYRELARHYGFRIDPAPPLSPEKKGKVESGVKYVKRNFFKPRSFESIQQAREELVVWLREVAAKRVHGTTARQPGLLFEQEEATKLLVLPERPWSMIAWKRVRLHRDAHVQVDGAFYSAPWSLLGKDLWARCTRKSIVLYHEDERVATHSRVSRGQRSTTEEHLPEHRRDWRQQGRTHWLERASRIGTESRRYVEEMFAEDEALDRLRQVQAVVTYLEKHPIERAERACVRARSYGARGYVPIRNILQKGLDFEDLEHAKGQRDWSRNSRFARSPRGLTDHHKEDKA